MSHRDTTRRALLAAALLAASGLPLTGQPAADHGWRPVGNTLRLLGLPSPAGGPVERLWFSAGGQLHLMLSDGRRFETSDWESWAPSTSSPPPAAAAVPAGRLENGASLHVSATPAGLVYAGGEHLYRSADGGRTWENLTEWQGESLLGGRIRDIAPDPGDNGRIAVATEAGIWLTHDGGRTWIGLNEGLPNLPVRSFVSLPQNGRHLQVAIASGSATELLEWIPGQRAGWARAGSPDPGRALRARLGEMLGADVLAAARTADGVLYAGENGQIRASLDNGRTWRVFSLEGAAVERFWVAPGDSRTALAALRQGRVLRTLNGGVWWDDITANLAAGTVYGLAAERDTGVIYAATEQGLYWTLGDLRAPAPATPWRKIEGLPGPAAVRDAALDDAGARLFVAVDGYGIWVAPAPHRAIRPAAVHTADFGLRPAAPGALVSVVGARSSDAMAGGRPAAVLSATFEETQLQIPFDVSGELLNLRLSASPAPHSFDLPLRVASPAVLTDRDGTPMLLDAESGLPLDAANPGRPGMVIQILATGLGRVDPEWPTGLAAPLEAPPRVRARVRVLLDGVELPVLQATLAPGYVGYYLVEVQLPDFLDSGLSALVVEAAGNASPPAAIHLDQ